MTTTASSKKKKGSTPRWLAIPAPKPQLSEAEVNAKYPRMRLQVFMGIFIGYATFYLIRNNVPLVTPILTTWLQQRCNRCTVHGAAAGLRLQQVLHRNDF